MWVKNKDCCLKKKEKIRVGEYLKELNVCVFINVKLLLSNRPSLNIWVIYVPMKVSHTADIAKRMQDTYVIILQKTSLVIGFA